MSETVCKHCGYPIKPYPQNPTGWAHCGTDAWVNDRKTDACVRKAEPVQPPAAPLAELPPLATELFERSKRDDELIVGSEIRAAIAEMRDDLTKANAAKRVFEDTVASQAAELSAERDKRVKAEAERDSSQARVQEARELLTNCTDHLTVVAPQELRENMRKWLEKAWTTMEATA